MNSVDVFEDVVHLPDGRGQTDYDRLIGLDEYKERLVKETLLLIDPARLQEWNHEHHRGELAALDYFNSRRRSSFLPATWARARQRLPVRLGTRLPSEQESKFTYTP